MVPSWRGAVVAALAILSAYPSPAQDSDGDFVSVYSEAVGLAAFSARFPSVNSSGTVAFAALAGDPSDGRSEWVVFTSDGVRLVPLCNLTDVLGPGSPLSLVINDASAIAVNYTIGPRAVIVRLDANCGATVLAEADQAGSMPYREFATTISMNNAGQVAALVTNQDSTRAILRLGHSGAVELARSSPERFNFSSPAINDSGVVAFKAQGPLPDDVSLYTGSGGPLTDEGVAAPCRGSSAQAPVINNDGLVLSDCGNPPLFTVRAGVVNVLLSGTEDPIFARLASTSSYSLNNRGRPAFVTGPGGLSTEVGLFTGNDPVGNKIVRTGDLVFGFTVEDIRVGQRSINDAGRIAFLLQVGDGATVTSHVVLATPGRTPQTISFPTLASHTFGDLPFLVTATASSGLPVLFAASDSCSVDGRTVTLLSAGVCTLTASQSGDAAYLPAPDVSQTFAIGRARQAVAFAPLPDLIFGHRPFSVSATASSGLPVTFSAAGACSSAGDLVTVTGAGSCTVIAAQSGDANYEPAPGVTHTFAIARAGQTITFDRLPDRTFGDPESAVSATASSGLAVSFSASGTCVVSGGVVTLTGAGSCTVTAAQSGDDNYLPAPEVVRAFAVAMAGQAITFGLLPNRRLGDPPFAVSAVASSGLPVSFSAIGSCSMVGATVSPTAAGLCTITASQAGNADFEPAPPVARTFQIAGVIREAQFDAGADGFSYVDDAFRGTGQAGYSSGTRMASGGFRGGALHVSLGGIDNTAILGMSGGWRTTFSLSAPTKVLLYVRGSLTQSPDYSSDERSQLLVSVDGVLMGAPPNDFQAQIVGDGRGGSARSTGWRLFTLNLGTLDPGPHTLVIGGYNNKKTSSNESTTVLIDDVLLMDATAGAQAAVAALNFERFKENIRVLADFGDRTQGTASNNNANNWLENQLRAAGYTVERHPYAYLGQPRYSVYATKVGTFFPDQMFIISAHMDGRGGGGAADDDASGCSLVLESARALARLQTAVSVRFIFWNNEETGLNGSTAYVNERAGQQGAENPPGSGLYPEPRWVGLIQHDMILFDHGLSAQRDQIAGADIDIEYQAASTYANQALQLAQALRAGNQTHSTDYSAQVGSNMRFTDSWPFRNYTAAVSVRENQRVAEIGNGANPHWHQPTDVYTAYSEADFRFGFNTVQMTLGTVAELAGAMFAP
jgi:hypothetical protein